MAISGAISLEAGQIVIADWRGDARPAEQNKLRPAIVVHDERLFPPAYQNVILVPMSGDAGWVVPDLVLTLEPSPANGCIKPCWAISYLVTTLSKARISMTPSRIEPDQLETIRRQIALSIGLAR